jgi:RNA polymerase sigma factor (sigma-70 family)
MLEGMEEISPALAAPGSNSYGNGSRSTGLTDGRGGPKNQALSKEDADDLCERYLPLAYSIAGQYSQRGVDLDDLRSAGLTGLVLATKKFDPERGSFGTYAKYWIKGQILELFKPKADALNRASSLDAPRWTEEDKDGNSKLDLVIDDAPPIATLDVSALSERERGIFGARIEGRTLDEIGSDLGVSRERARQLNERAIEKVRTKKGNVARSCIRSLLDRRGYKRPSHPQLPFRAIKYPGHAYTSEELADFVYGRTDLLVERGSEWMWWDTHRLSCLYWMGCTTSEYRFKNDGPPKFQRWPR